MTLYRQLLIFTLLLIFLLFAGTWFAKLSSTRTFLLDQLESHAQDTATSLGLSISPYVAQDDMASVETMFNAVFDRGYYSTIKFVDMQDTPLVDRALQVASEGVPQWFIHIVALPTPRATAMVHSGWTQAGEVIVESHPGYAYRTLWQTVVRTTIWFVITGIVVIIGGGLGLRMLLKPLARVEHQAESLCKRQYEIQEEIPKTRELRSVVIAMNKMTYKIKEMFEEHVRVAEHLRKNAYRDSLTGLGNRRYLEGQVATRLQRGDSSVNGAFLLVQINDLQAINKEKGFQAGDAILEKMSNVLLKEITSNTNMAIARLTGGDFAVFMPDVNIAGTEQVAGDIVKGLFQMAVENLGLSDNIGHVGGVIYNRTTDFSQLLAGADTALRAAQTRGRNKWVVNRMSDDPKDKGRGEQNWKDLLLKAIEENKITLFAQPTVSCQNRNVLFHREVFSRILDESGGMLSAGLFIPLAERLGLVSSLDRLVLEQALKTTVAALGADQLAVNVSPTSLKDRAFREWVIKKLKEPNEKAPKLSFEFSEFSALQNFDLIKAFGAQLQDLGHGYGIDHFGQGFSNFGYLKTLRPDYVKIDRAYTDELKTKDSDSYFFIGSLTGVAHSLDIKVIAEGVENEVQFNLLQELNLDAIQGYYIDRPKPV